MPSHTNSTDDLELTVADLPVLMEAQLKFMEEGKMHEADKVREMILRVGQLAHEKGVAGFEDWPMVTGDQNNPENPLDMEDAFS